MFLLLLFFSLPLMFLSFRLLCRKNCCCWEYWCERKNFKSKGKTGWEIEWVRERERERVEWESRKTRKWEFVSESEWGWVKDEFLSPSLSHREWMERENDEHTLLPWLAVQQFVVAFAHLLVLLFLPSFLFLSFFSLGTKHERIDTMESSTKARERKSKHVEREERIRDCSDLITVRKRGRENCLDDHTWNWVELEQLETWRNEQTQSLSFLPISRLPFLVSSILQSHSHERKLSLSLPLPLSLSLSC